MDLENELADLLEESVGRLDPPIAVIVAEGARLGRRRQLRRRLQTAGAVLTVAALATTGAVCGLGHGGRPSLTAATLPSPAASAPASASASASAPSGGPSPSTSPTPNEPATAQMTPEALLKIVADQLPPGGMLDKFEQHPFGRLDPTQEVAASVQYIDGQGASTLQISLRHQMKQDPNHPINLPPWGCPTSAYGDEGPRVPGADPIGCTDRVLPDGSREMDMVSSADVLSLYCYQVAILRPNGEIVQLYTYNGTVNPYGSKTPVTVTRTKPPVPLATWEAIAESPKWQLKVPQSAVDAGAALADTVRHVPDLTTRTG